MAASPEAALCTSRGTTTCGASPPCSAAIPLNAPLPKNGWPFMNSRHRDLRLVAGHPQPRGPPVDRTIERLALDRGYSRFLHIRAALVSTDVPSRGMLAPPSASVQRSTRSAISRLTRCLVPGSRSSGPFQPKNGGRLPICDQGHRWNSDGVLVPNMPGTQYCVGERMEPRRILLRSRKRPGDDYLTDRLE